MTKTGAIKFANGIKATTKKNAPTIAIVVGIFCFGCSIISAIEETPKAIRLINEKKEELGLEEDEKLPVGDAFKAVWKCYALAAISFTAGGLCILGANKMFCTRNTALAAAYQLSESTFREYKKKVAEVVGEKQEKFVRDDIQRDKIKANPPVASKIYVTGRGKTRCYDSLTDRYFESDLETIRQKINEINRRLNYEHFISLNEYYYELGLPRIDSSIGDNLGWNIESGLIEFEPTSILPEDGIPTLAIQFLVGPRYEYRY